MQFWSRHFFLILACVVGPFIGAIYLDTASELGRAARAGELAVRLESQSFESRLMLDAHAVVNTAISLAQRVSDRDLLAELAAKAPPRREAAISTIAELLKEAAPAGGFAWLIDDDGMVLARSGQTGLDEKPQRIIGHPLFLETQEGYALDGLWKGDGKVALTGAAPVILHGQAQGAVFVGRVLDRKQIVTMAKALNSEITLIADDRVVTSTMDENVAAANMKVTNRSSEPASSGTLSKPLGHRFIPFLPLFVDHDARGLAFTSLERSVPGSPDLRWLVTVQNERMLKDLAPRQELMLTGLVMFAMLAILIGLMNHRTFVSPIQKLTDHLSELQLGRGELELPESKVSAPFRRMVKLINMTVQKIPARGFSTRPTGSNEAQAADLGSDRLVARDIGVGSLLKTNDVKHENMIQAYEPPLPAPQSGSSAASHPLATGSNDTEHRPASSFMKENVFDGDDNALADAVAAIARAAPPLPAIDANPREEDDEAAEIARAIASLESGRPTSAGTTPPPARLARGASKSSAPTPPPADLSRPTQRAGGPRSAAEIRGVPSTAIAGVGGPGSPFAAPGSDLGALGDAEEAHQPQPGQPDHDLMMAATSIDLPGIRPGTTRGGGSLASYASVGGGVVDENAFNPEATVVAPVQDELLRRSARPENTDAFHLPTLGSAMPESSGGDMTMVASVPANLLAQTMAGAEIEEPADDGAGLDPADHAHFKETYERFIEMRRRCGEATGDLAFDRFLAKLTKNREGLIKKYNCRTVRFQVYEKDGKAALKATPVRAR